MTPTEHWADGSFVQAEAVIPAGHRFHSADRNAPVIDLFEAAPRLAPGEPVLLAGHVQQIQEGANGLEAWGWPPNFRVYEYVTVDSVDGATVALRGRLRHAYDETWPDWLQPQHASTNLYGAPRLYRTRFPGYTLQRSLRIERAVFVANRSKPYTPLGFTGLHIHLEDCKVEGNVPLHMSHTEHFEAIGCEFGGCEMDKINRRVRFDRCLFRGALTGMGAGVEELMVRDCDIMGDAHGRGLDIAPRDAQFAGIVRVFGRTIFQNEPTVAVPGPVIISAASLQ
jgi:hypothetical protein